MQRQRGELVPVGEVIADLPGPVQALIPSRSTQHHFTLADQVNQLVSASEAEPDRGFMARTMALCSLPRSNPGNQYQYQRVNGPYKLILSRTGLHKLPHGSNPRLILAWISTEAVRTGSREIVLGRSLSEFMRKLGISSTDGRGQARLRNQMKRLFNCSVQLNYTASRSAGRERSACGSQQPRRQSCGSERRRRGSPWGPTCAAGRWGSGCGWRRSCGWGRRSYGS